MKQRLLPGEACVRHPQVRKVLPARPALLVQPEQPALPEQLVPPALQALQVLPVPRV